MGPVRLTESERSSVRAPDPPFRRVTFRVREVEGSFETKMAAGWDILCSACRQTVLGRLWMPFSGGHILAGSSSTLDPRLVERDGPEHLTGQKLRRYGPPTNLYGRPRGRRMMRSSGTQLSLNGSFWVYCFECNTGQAVEPERALTRFAKVVDSARSPRSERPRQER
jgi:hypothetical protein